jgi:hypothetical protein
MKYVSTRGAAPVLEFEEVLLTGLPRDGGLYVPETWPRFGAEDIRAFAHLDYGELAGARPLARPERPSSRTPLDLGGSWRCLGRAKWPVPSRQTGVHGQASDRLLECATVLGGGHPVM